MRRGRTVERGVELASVVEALARAPALVAVEGEAGIGKTRLVSDAVEHPSLGGRQLLVGAAYALDDPFPLGPVLEALVGARLPDRGRLSPLVGALVGLLPERAAELPPAPAALDDPRAERHRGLRAVRELLGALGPALLVLEDVHWADAGTLELLRVLAARPPEELSVALTFRSLEAPAGSPLRRMLAELPSDFARVRVELRPLSVAGVGELGASLHDVGDLTEEFARYLHEATGGVPFVVEELVQLLQDRGLVVRLDQAWRRRPLDELDVPPAVGSAVVERAARLSPQARAVLEAAAVFAAPADEQLLSEIADLDREAATAGVAEALRAGLLVELDTRVALRHALARQAIYDAISGPRRRQLHRTAARVIEATGDRAVVGPLAHHYREANDVANWARCAEAAADIAASLGDDAVAYRYLRDLLEAGAAPPERRPELTIKLGWAARRTPGAEDAAAALLARALQQPDLPTALRGELRWVDARLKFQKPESSDAAAAELRAALPDLDHRPDLQAGALGVLATPHWRKATMGEHLAYLEAARAAARRASDPMTAAWVAADAACLLSKVGDPDAATALEQLPTPGPSALVNQEILRALTNVAHASLEIGHYSRARNCAVRAARLVQRNPHLQASPLALDLDAADLKLRWTTGELEGVAEEAERLRAGPDATIQLDGELVYGEILLAHGALAQAQQPLSIVAERQQEWGELALAARAGAGVARIALARGDDESARTLAHQLLQVIAAKQIWVFAAPLVPFAPLDVLTGVLDDFRAGVAGRDAPLAAAALEFADARLAERGGDLATAADGYAHAHDGYARMPDPRMAAHAAEAQGRCLLALHDAAGAELLRTALRTFSELDAPWESKRIKHTMRNAGLRPPRGGGRRSYGDELSPREREIAERAAAGLTSREIADELFLSSRTIESHLGKAMRKLGISSRRQLAGALQESHARK